MSNIYYNIGGERITEEEYKKRFGDPPNRLKTFEDAGPRKQAIFEPYYDRALRKWCYSYKDQERKVNEFNRAQKELPAHLRDKQHPNGFVFAQDTKDWKQMMYDHKHGKEIRREQQRSREFRDDPRRHTPGKRIYSFGK